eukprot:TRINITY_DN49489_c0_g1_i1.p1 TRINITY_DN49489_c0_g1~~TRINITY_DN49489_c0_g1_i1.p1  ORF type:complete len:239 (-),score=33.87 TRINITY_DN49489_c0_g1_i1:457-1173(-)
MYGKMRRPSSRRRRLPTTLLSDRLHAAGCGGRVVRPFFVSLTSSCPELVEVPAGSTLRITAALPQHNADVAGKAAGSKTSTIPKSRQTSSAMGVLEITGQTHRFAGAEPVQLPLRGACSAGLRLTLAGGQTLSFLAKLEASLSGVALCGEPNDAAPTLLKFRMWRRAKPGRCGSCSRNQEDSVACRLGWAVFSICDSVRRQLSLCGQLPRGDGRAEVLLLLGSLRRERGRSGGGSVRR